MPVSAYPPEQKSHSPVVAPRRGVAVGEDMNRFIVLELNQFRLFP